MNGWSLLFIGRAETNATNNDEDSYFVISNNVPIFHYCMFALHKKCNVYHDAVITIDGQKALQKGQYFIVTVSGGFL